MKNKYVIPQIWIAKTECLTHFLAGSRSGSGGGVIGGDDDNNQEKPPVTPTPSGGGLIQHSKQFDAWASWDE